MKTSSSIDFVRMTFDDDEDDDDVDCTGGIGGSTIISLLVNEVDEDDAARVGFSV